uniref:Uncharacterized protein n=1 Tax=Picea glauca TaxID=3330 RepID=A0A101M4C4_PICGL|nr:hypothetical protein ABT39_MTgene508 [Picea glauca]QHR89439.1 hypothetical protein Q903MT_gene3460 [Picea sitchensis]
MHLDPSLLEDLEHPEHLEHPELDLDQFTSRISLRAAWNRISISIIINLITITKVLL